MHKVHEKFELTKSRFSKIYPMNLDVPNDMHIQLVQKVTLGFSVIYLFIFSFHILIQATCFFMSPVEYLLFI